MKQADVKIGGVYLTKIGDQLERVVVVQHRPVIKGDGFNKRDTYDVRRESEDRVLPKLRTAAALHPIPMREYQVVSDDVGNILQVWRGRIINELHPPSEKSSAWHEAHAWARMRREKYNESIVVHEIQCDKAPQIGQTISMTGVTS